MRSATDASTRTKRLVSRSRPVLVPRESLWPVDPGASVETTLTALDSNSDGLVSSEASRRQGIFGLNVLTAREATPWWQPVLHQFTHPLAMLLMAAGLISFVSDSPALGWTILGVVVLNAAFALVQEHQAERSVSALSSLLPQHVTTLRDGTAASLDVTRLVPGDVIVIAEGQRISADARVIAGELEVDLSTLNGESLPALRTSAPDHAGGDLLAAGNLVFSGTSCTAGSAHAVVFSTGDSTELGRIAALTRKPLTRESPLEGQVRRLTKLIAAVAVVAGVAFLPIGLAAGLSFRDSFLFATGLLVANVPEGLLPIITLALAAGAKVLAHRGVVLRRLSAVETLGSTTAICTDKTGTLTQNRMSPVTAWTAAGDLPIGPISTEDSLTRTFAGAVGACATADGGVDVASDMDPTEAAMLSAARTFLSADLPYAGVTRRHVFPFESSTRLMSTVDQVPSTEGPSGIRAEPDAHLVVHTKGAPEVVVAHCVTQLTARGTVALGASERSDALATAQRLARRGLRVLAVADRDLGQVNDWARDRRQVETGLRLLGYVALLDPPREQVPRAVARCHQAGVRVHVVTGDSAETAAEIARQVGIGPRGIRVILGSELDAKTDEELQSVFEPPYEVVCARSTPENKMRITGVLQREGEVVAVTGDGVNDAPSLRKADIGIAMGLGGTDVAREAASAVLVEDDFSAIAMAIEEGRRVYANVRKFIIYIFSHAVAEVVPFLIFALSGGAVPLPITVLQILAIDLGTETLCALALAREPAEPGIMTRGPKPLSEPLVTGQMLWRSWGLLGITSATLTMGAFFYVLLTGGWRWGDDVGPSTALHGVYLEATTATFVAIVAIVACQAGTAVAARSSRASLASIGWSTNRLLLLGLAVGVAFAAALVYLPFMNALIATAPLHADVLLVILPFPVLVWGVDELYRARLRSRGR